MTLPYGHCLSKVLCSKCRTANQGALSGKLGQNCPDPGERYGRRINIPSYRNRSRRSKAPVLPA